MLAFEFLVLSLQSPDLLPAVMKPTKPTLEELPSGVLSLVSSFVPFNIQKMVEHRVLL